MLGMVGGRYSLAVDGCMVEASLRGRAKNRSRPQVLVGDRVSVAVSGEGDATIEAVLPRHNILRRRTPGRRRGVRNVAANVDQVVVVGSAESPPWDGRMIDRFLAVAGANDIPAILVINKADLAPDASALGAPYRAAGYDVLVTSAPNGLGIDELKARLHGKVSLFTGSTGVGKSSLLNLIEPGLALRTAPVSRKTRGGRHTTVAATMHALPGGGFVVDTPGLRDVGLWGLKPKDVEAAFPEFASVAPGCRFDDCRHMQEPGCAVVSAAAAGEIDQRRLESYRRLLDEAMVASRFWE